MLSFLRFSPKFCHLCHGDNRNIYNMFLWFLHNFVIYAFPQYNTIMIQYFPIIYIFLFFIYAFPQYNITIIQYFPIIYSFRHLCFPTIWFNNNTTISHNIFFLSSLLSHKPDGRWPKDFITTPSSEKESTPSSSWNQIFVLFVKIIYPFKYIPVVKWRQMPCQVQIFHKR